MKPAKSPAQRPARKAPAWLTVCVGVFLVLAVLAVFGQTAGFEFVNYDDDEAVYQNSMVQKGLSVKAVGWAFTHAQLSNWVPLATLSHMLDCQIFGLHAGAHHLVNVLWHAATAVLLFLVMRQMTGRLWRSAFVAAVFALHPLRAESVAWVSERKDVLSAFFFILAIGAYARYAEGLKVQGSKFKVFYSLCLVFFVLGLMSKPMVATLPFVLLLLDYWPLQRFHHLRQFLRLLHEKIPLFVLSAATCLSSALVPGLIITDARQLPLLARVSNALVSYAVYLRQMVFPKGLTVLYPGQPVGFALWQVGLALVLLAAISVVVMVLRKKQPSLLVGWCWFLGMLVPVIGIIQISGDAAHADRYTYLPGIGLIMAVTWAVADLSAGWKLRRMVLAVLMLAVVGALSVCAYLQTSYWKDSASLWTRALACTSANAIAHLNLGNALKARGKLDDAILQFRQALALDPYNVAALNNLGNALGLKGADDDAIAQYQKAAEIQPGNADIHFNLGNRLLRQGKLDQAVAHFRKALAIRPNDAAAENNLGKALLLKGDFDGAMACFEKTILGSPAPQAIWHNLGNGFLQKQDWDSAIACFRQEIKIQPRSADACANIGVAFFEKGEAKEAMDSWQLALEINPAQMLVQNNLAWLLATTTDTSLRNGTKALALATQANQLSGGGNPVILHTLAAAYAEAGNYEKATVTARRALELARAQKNDALAAKLQKEIQLYHTNTPLRQGPR